LSVFVTVYKVILEALHVVSEDGDTTARSLDASIMKFDFIIAAMKLQYIFKYTHILSVTLQSPDLALVEASKEARVCVCTL